MSIIVKKTIASCIILILTMSMSACGKDTSMVEEIASKQDGTVQGTTEVESKLQDSDEKNETDIEETKEINNVDVDLTVLSSTMVYSEVYNMMVNPDVYLGKTIKVIGPYYAGQLVYGTEKYYHFVVISDATACCQNGIEFIWDDNSHVYPDEYPKDNTVIEITGVFSSYEESGNTYYYLKTNGITIK
jgi:hypothetical protein